MPDPWSPDAFDGLKAGEPILLIGTGLTMVDVATFVAYPILDLDTLRAWRLTPGAKPCEISIAVA